MPVRNCKGFHLIYHIGEIGNSYILIPKYCRRILALVGLMAQIHMVIIVQAINCIFLYLIMVRVYDRMIMEGKILEFEYNNSNNKITDKQTGTEWNFDGEALNGTLKGTHLTRLPFDEGFWFEWVAFHP